MNAPRRTPDWLLERIALGELPADELERCRRDLLAEPDGAERLAAVEQSNQQILQRYPLADFTEQQRRRRQGHGVPWLHKPVVLVPAAAALATMLAWVIWPAYQSALQNQMSATTTADRSKGLQTQLAVFRQRSDGDERVLEDALVQPGDVLQLRYTAAGYRHGVLLSIDGRGEVTLHFPKSATASTALMTQGEQLLDHAYELDDAPGFERFFFVVSKTPIAVESVLRSAGQLAQDPVRAGTDPLPIDARMQQISVRLRKDQP